MKKFLLSIAALALSATPLLADEATLTYADMELAASSVVKELTSGDVTVKFATAAGTKDPTYYSTGRIYVYKNNEVTISVPEGYTLKSITNTASGGTYSFTYTSCTTGKNMTSSAYTADQVWAPTEDITTSVTFVMSKTVYMTKTVVEYEAVSASRKPAALAYPEASYTTLFGDAFTAPVLSKATDAPATYTSSNPFVATVNAETGAVTINATGTTVITAACEETEEYYAGSAEYTLVVKASDVATAGSHTIICSQANREGFGGANATLSADGVLFTIAKKATGNAPTFNETDGDVRIYGGSTVAVKAAGDYIMTHIVFNLSDLGVQRLPVITCDEGEIVQSSSDNKVQWYGCSNTVTLKIGDNSDLGTTEATGVLAFKSVDVEYDVYTGVNAIKANDAEAVYYDLNGRQVKNPVNGIYVKVANGKASKVVIK